MYVFQRPGHVAILRIGVVNINEESPPLTTYKTEQIIFLLLLLILIYSLMGIWNPFTHVPLFILGVFFKKIGIPLKASRRNNSDDWWTSSGRRKCLRVSGALKGAAAQFRACSSSLPPHFSLTKQCHWLSPYIKKRISIASRKIQKLPRRGSWWESAGNPLGLNVMLKES